MDNKQIMRNSDEINSRCKSTDSNEVNPLQSIVHVKCTYHCAVTNLHYGNQFQSISRQTKKDNSVMEICDKIRLWSFR